MNSRILVIAPLLAAFAWALPALAQEAEPSTPAAPAPAEGAAPAEGEAAAPATIYVLDGQTLVAGDQVVRLLGIVGMPFGSGGGQARGLLDGLVNEREVTCDVRGRNGELLIARCVNQDSVDLSKALLTAGLATVDRRQVFGSALSDEYEAAEAEARDARRGLWEKELGKAEPEVEDPATAAEAEPTDSADTLGLLQLVATLALIGVVIFNTVSLSSGLRKLRALIR